MFGCYGKDTVCTLGIITRTKKRGNRSVKQYLMVRNNRGMNAGLFNFPGGKIEKNEMIEESIIREIYEETGYTLNKYEPCGRFDIYFGEQKDTDPLGYVHPPRCRVYIYQSDDFSGELRNPLLKEGQKVPEVKAFWCDEDKIPFDKMRDNDVYWFRQYISQGYVNNLEFVRLNDKMHQLIMSQNKDQAREENEVQTFEQMTIAKHPKLAEKHGLTF